MKNPNQLPLFAVLLVVSTGVISFVLLWGGTALIGSLASLPVVFFCGQMIHGCMQRSYDRGKLDGVMAEREQRMGK